MLGEPSVSYEPASADTGKATVAQFLLGPAEGVLEVRNRLIYKMDDARIAPELPRR